MTLCVISDWLHQWLIYITNAPQMCVCYEFFWFVFYCKSHFKEDFTILFHTNKSVNFCLVDFVSEKHLFVASFASKCKLFDKDESDFYHKDLVRAYQKQNLALSWLKPASCWSTSGFVKRKGLGIVKHCAQQIYVILLALRLLWAIC